MSKRVSMNCPHCRANAIARTSKEMSITMREITFVCTNEKCGHVWVSTLEAARTLSPSAIPNLAVKLPFSPHINRVDLLSQLSEPETA